MEQKIEIRNIPEVREKILAVNLLLKQYTEEIKGEASGLLQLETLILEASQVVAKRKGIIYTEIERIRKYDDSPEKQQALEDCQRVLERIERQERTVSKCKDDLLGIRRDMQSIVNESITLSDTASVLTSKIQILLDRIIETM